jgi:ribonuclease P protein component
MEILFKKGKSFNAFPLKIIFLMPQFPLPFPAQAMFVVPKRNFKRSPDRNRLKRQMRESYRLIKSSFYDQLGASEKQLILAILYTGNKKVDYSIISHAVNRLLEKVLRV